MRGGLTEGYCDWYYASHTQLLLQQIYGDADLDDIGPDLMHGLPSVDDPLHVGTHERQTSRWVHIAET
jgi:hypothetical protein